MELTVNGRTETLMLDPRTTLLDWLREHLNLTGTRKMPKRVPISAT